MPIIRSFKSQSHTVFEFVLIIFTKFVKHNAKMKMPRLVHDGRELDTGDWKVRDACHKPNCSDVAVFLHWQITRMGDSPDCWPVDDGVPPVKSVCSMDDLRFVIGPATVPPLFQFHQIGKDEWTDLDGTGWQVFALANIEKDQYAAHFAGEMNPVPIKKCFLIWTTFHCFFFCHKLDWFYLSMRPSSCQSNRQPFCFPAAA